MHYYDFGVLHVYNYFRRLARALANAKDIAASQFILETLFSESSEL